MAANRPAHQPFVREPVDAAAFAVTHAAGVNDGKSRRMALMEEPRFECGEHEVRLVDTAARAVNQYRRTVGDKRRRRCGRHDFGHFASIAVCH